MLNLVWLRRPGTASTLTPKAGTVHEWMTSAAETRTRIWVFIGKTVRLSTSSTRNPESSSSLEGIIYESN